MGIHTLCMKHERQCKFILKTNCVYFDYTHASNVLKSRTRTRSTTRDRGRRKDKTSRVSFHCSLSLAQFTLL